MDQRVGVRASDAVAERPVADGGRPRDDGDGARVT